MHAAPAGHGNFISQKIFLISSSCALEESWKLANWDSLARVNYIYLFFPLTLAISFARCTAKMKREKKWFHPAPGFDSFVLMAKFKSSLQTRVKRMLEQFAQNVMCLENMTYKWSFYLISCQGWINFVARMFHAEWRKEVEIHILFI